MPPLPFLPKAGGVAQPQKGDDTGLQSSLQQTRLQQTRYCCPAGQQLTRRGRPPGPMSCCLALRQGNEALIVAGPCAWGSDVPESQALGSTA